MRAARAHVQIGTSTQGKAGMIIKYSNKYSKIPYNFSKATLIAKLPIKKPDNKDRYLYLYFDHFGQCAYSEVPCLTLEELLGFSAS